MAHRYSDYWSEYGYKKTTPITVKNGIKAQSKRGSFASKWWAKRWIAILESFDINSRLSRGRTYARNGQVFDLVIKKGLAQAKVQGSQRKPYVVTIKISTILDTKWGEIIQVLASKASYSAKLLTGEMPEIIETLFEDVGASLFPSKKSDLETNCSCPDWSNPCKHVAAVYYLLAEEFDRNPFLIFKLRGMEQSELMDKLGKMVADSEIQDDAQNFEDLSLSEPLPIDDKEFWKEQEILLPQYTLVHTHSIDAVLAKELGTFPFWSGQTPFLQTMETLYSKGSSIAQYQIES